MQKVTKGQDVVRTGALSAVAGGVMKFFRGFITRVPSETNDGRKPARRRGFGLFMPVPTLTREDLRSMRKRSV